MGELMKLRREATMNLVFTTARYAVFVGDQRVGMVEHKRVHSQLRTRAQYRWFVTFQRSDMDVTPHNTRAEAVAWMQADPRWPAAVATPRAADGEVGHA